MQYYLAIDIGASSGRHILGCLDNGKIVLEEVHRFPNVLSEKDGILCWDLEALLTEVIAGLIACKKRGKIPVSVGIDTWGVDFALLNKDGDMLGPTVAYRDSRTAGMDAEIDKFISESELYARTGIQKMIFNTIYQLAAVKKRTPDILEQADRLLMIPDYLHYRLAGIGMSEYTNATTTGLVNARTGTWDMELIDLLGYPCRIFGELHAPGTVVGKLSEKMQSIVGFDCTVVLPPTHDTASAFLAVPAACDTSVYISSGTWSLMGVERLTPITTEESRKANFTNEGGYQRRFRYLKNIMGLWMIQSIRKEEDGISFQRIIDIARASDYTGIVDVNASRFLAPESMTDAVKLECKENGYDGPISLGDVAKCVYNSLAHSYAQTVNDLTKLTNKSYTCINIIGGGCQDGYLNELTAQACGLPVYAGPVEGTAVGNLVSQMIADNRIDGIDTARALIRESFC